MNPSGNGQAKAAFWRHKTQNRLAIRDFCLIGLFVALIAAFAQIAVPMPAGVPFTLQTLAVMLAGCVLGARRGTLCAVVYVLLGACGVPVFRAFSGGPAILLGPTGGFLFSFPLLALFSGLGARAAQTAARKAPQKASARPKKPALLHSLWLSAGMLLGSACTLTSGALYYAYHTAVPLSAAFYACMWLLWPAEMLKILCAAIVGRRLRDVRILT